MFLVFRSPHVATSGWHFPGYIPKQRHKAGAPFFPPLLFLLKPLAGCRNLRRLFVCVTMTFETLNGPAPHHVRHSPVYLFIFSEPTLMRELNSEHLAPSLLICLICLPFFPKQFRGLHLFQSILFNLFYKYLWRALSPEEKDLDDYRLLCLRSVYFILFYVEVV